MATLPDIEAVRRLFTDLLGRPVQAAGAQRAESPIAVASYVDDGGDLVAVISCDLQLACSAGGALSMIPPGVVKDLLKKGSMDEVVGENIHEVFNIAASLWNRPGEPHVRLREITAPREVPGDVKTLMTKGKSKRAMSLDVGGYGTGTLAITAA